MEACCRIVAWAEVDKRNPYTVTANEGGPCLKCPYGQPGDRLWVREAWTDAGEITIYRADTDGLCRKNIRWKPSIHMPRKESRILLEITDVRIERLQDISSEDCHAEGSACGIEACIDIFARSWESLHGPGSWEKNPWVWVISFRRLK
jgi:hypothetical protein